MKLAQTTSTTIDDSVPASFTCAQCPFARQIEDNRYCCQVSQTASDVRLGHWEATVSCFEALAKAEAEQTPEPVTAEVEEAPIAQTEQTPIALATSSTPSTPAATNRGTRAPTATGTNDDAPPNRGDNDRNCVEPISAPKKLMLSLVALKRISSDIPASNFDRFELEIAGELSLAIGGFVVPPVLVRDSDGYRVVSGHLQYHAAVLARRLNPRADETIPGIILEEENQSAVLAQLGILKHRAA